MAGADSHDGLVGRGMKEGATLFRSWFDRLTGAAADGSPTAYVFVMGSLAEILRVFDFELSFPEINSLQTAIRHVAHEYLNQAEDYGYSPDICGYVKADVAVQLRKGAHPMGTLPPPALAVATNACNTYIKWAEIWERLYHVPVFTLDVPGTRRADRQTWPGDPDFEEDRRYVAAQIGELIALCEQVTRKRFDIDRLRETMGHTNAMTAAWRRVIALNQHRPAVFNALTEGTVYLGVANGFRGMREGRLYFADLLDEMEDKAAHGLGTHRRGTLSPRVRRRALLPDLPAVQRHVHGMGRRLRQLDLPLVRVRRRRSRLRVRPRTAARESRRRRAHLGASRDGRDVPSGPRHRGASRAIPTSTAWSSIQSRAAGPFRPAWPTAGAH